MPTVAIVIRARFIVYLPLCLQKYRWHKVMPAWKRMFQTITGKPFCPIAAIAAPENFSAGSSRRREPRPSVWLPKGDCPGGVSGTLTKGLGGLHQGEHRGRGECSSRNVRHEQTVGHALLEMPDH